MELDFTSMSPREVYGFMTQTIIPRPVAWVLSDNGDGSHNLAPFSYFNGVASRPPILSISIGKKRDGNKKDTWRNIEERNHFVVHIAGAELASEVSATSAPLEFGLSEVEENRLELLEQSGWNLPRLARARVALLCEKDRIIEVGEGPQGLVLGRIRRAFVDEAIVGGTTGEGLRVAATGLDPLARLGGDEYAALGRVFRVARPE